MLPFRTSVKCNSGTAVPLTSTEGKGGNHAGCSRNVINLRAGFSNDGLVLNFTAINYRSYRYRYWWSESWLIRKHVCCSIEVQGLSMVDSL